VSAHNGEEHIREVEEATRYLLTMVIPAFASKLNMMKRCNTDFNLKEAMHNDGINMRYLGVVRRFVTSEAISHLLLVEMVARVQKHQLRHLMRQLMKDLKLPLEHKYRTLVVQHFNLTFENSNESLDYWDTSIKPLLFRYFSAALQEHERNVPLKRMLTDDDMTMLFRRLVKMTHIRFARRAEKEFSHNGKAFQSTQPFDVTYIEELCVSVRHMNIVALAQGYVLKSKARDKHGGLDKDRLCRMAIEKFQEALSDHPGDKRVLRELADSADIIGDSVLANDYYRRAIAADPKDANTLFKYAVFLENKKDYAGAEEFYLLALEHNPRHDHCLQRYGYFLDHQGNNDRAEEFYVCAAECRQNAKQLMHKASDLPIVDRPGMFY
jgi:tetratricopeptide (TPR) repeat protein